MEIATHVVGPQCFPQAENICPLKFAFVPDQKHAEEKEKVGRVSRLQVQVKCGIHKLDKMVEGQKLVAHPRLVSKEVTLLEESEQREGRNSSHPLPFFA